MANRFLTVFKTIFSVGVKIAPFAADVLAPGFAPLINVALQGIASAEAKFPAASTGESKAEHALTAVAAEAPQIVSTIEQLTGKKLVNDALFAEGCSDLNNALVKLLGSFGVIKTAPPVTPVPSAAVPV